MQSEERTWQSFSIATSALQSNVPTKPYLDVLVSNRTIRLPSLQRILICILCHRLVIAQRQYSENLTFLAPSCRAQSRSIPRAVQAPSCKYELMRLPQTLRESLAQSQRNLLSDSRHNEPSNSSSRTSTTCVSFTPFGADVSSSSEPLT